MKILDERERQKNKNTKEQRDGASYRERKKDRDKNRKKKDRDKTLLKNWRPISLLHLDLKIVLKALASRLKTVLPYITSSKQTTYLEKRFIGETGRLISDILSVTNNSNIKSYLVTMDIEKAFDSLDHSFLISVLKNLDLGKISLIGSKYCYIRKNRAY